MRWWWNKTISNYLLWQCKFNASTTPVPCHPYIYSCTHPNQHNQNKMWNVKMDMKKFLKIIKIFDKVIFVLLFGKNSSSFLLYFNGFWAFILNLYEGRKWTMLEGWQRVVETENNAVDWTEKLPSSFGIDSNWLKRLLLAHPIIDWYSTLSTHFFLDLHHFSILEN